MLEKKQEWSQEPWFLVQILTPACHVSLVNTSELFNAFVLYFVEHGGKIR